MAADKRILTPDEMFQAALLAYIQGAAGSGHAHYEVVDMAYRTAAMVRDREKFRQEQAIAGDSTEFTTTC